MTIEEARKAAEVMLAYANGEEVEVIGFGGQYKIVENPSFNWEKMKYRVKPKPTYRPFEDKEECWNEMLKHEPFGWVKKINGGYKQIMAIHMDMFNKHCADFSGQTGTACFEFEYIYKNYTFADGTPFGIKEG